MTIDNSYARLPEQFYQRIEPVPVKEPKLIRLNRPLADRLELDLPDDDDMLARLFAGNELFDWSEPIAQAYAGHQFGHFVPQLGDGRAILLGEAVTGDGRRFDIQLKGSGITRFSRGGDGRAPLGPVIREYVVSEAMHALGIPTTRSLAMVSTGEKVYRETPLPGAVLTRVAASHIRVGTFEYFASQDDFDSAKLLADHAIERHYPEARQTNNPSLAMFDAVCRSQASLVARWLSIGFIHGVMNTDNTTLSGETIDFGPCAFMDEYNPAQVYSSIDHQGRYAFNNQPNIAQWNMACLGGCLAPLIDADRERGSRLAQDVLHDFPDMFREAYSAAMCAKLGLNKSHEKGMELVQQLQEMMHRNSADFTNTFRDLIGALDGDSAAAFASHFSSEENIDTWLADWRGLIVDQGQSAGAARNVMTKANPAYIPRNHRVEEAIRAAEDRGDFAPMDRLIEVLAHPYDDQPENVEYRNPPQPDERVYQTFCGT